MVCLANPALLATLGDPIPALTADEQTALVEFLKGLRLVQALLHGGAPGMIRSAVTGAV